MESRVGYVENGRTSQFSRRDQSAIKIVVIQQAANTVLLDWSPLTFLFARGTKNEPIRQVEFLKAENEILRECSHSRYTLDSPRNYDYSMTTK